LHRQGRLEIAPAASFTLLDEYQHTIFLGGRLSFNLTDWVAIGVWGAAGAIKTPAALSDHIQEVTSFALRDRRGRYGQQQADRAQRRGRTSRSSSAR